MADFLNLTHHIHRVFETRPEVVRICEEITRYVEAGAGSRKLHLTMSLLRKHTHPSTDTDLLLALQYLAGAEAELLEPNFEYLDENGEALPLATDQVAQGAEVAAASLGVTFTRPEDFEARVMMYFRPTARAVEELRRREAV